jgi:hypothetical protein
MGRIRIQDIEVLDEERPSRKENNPKKKGRIQVDEKEFPQKKKDTHIGRNKRNRNGEI